jgi:nicotinamide-nucleotide amidase
MTEPAATEVIAALRERGLTLATAESLTGGLIGSLLTEVPGASDVYRGGVITYATELKASLGGVREATLDAVGPVAAQTAVELAVGAALTCGADWGLAVTGVAGPDAQDGHPVGQVFVAVAGPGREPSVEEFSFAGSRAEIRTQTAERALAALHAALAE